MLFIQGRAALVSGPKRQSPSENIPIPPSRSIASTSTSALSSSFSNVEHIRSYSLSRNHSEYMSSNSTTPTTCRRASISDAHEKARRSLLLKQKK